MDNLNFLHRTLTPANTRIRTNDFLLYTLILNMVTLSICVASLIATILAQECPVYVCEDGGASCLHRTGDSVFVNDLACSELRMHV
jgi:hypothetical protein